MQAKEDFTLSIRPPDGQDKIQALKKVITENVSKSLTKRMM
jgi:hypothetical protein